MKYKAGFTLIEITVSLVLVGLIASIAGTSVIMGMQGYLFARENDVITQKAQLALSRLNREFIELSDVKDASSTCIVYQSPYGTRAIARVSNTIQFFSSANSCSNLSGGDILVDRVQDFTIKYNGAATWATAQDIRNLYALYFKIDLSRPDTGGIVSFETSVSPRNNNNAGGASVPTASNPPPEYSGKQCFVTTAAWGDPDHPVVEVLRQFRDRVLLHSAVGMAMIRYYYEVGPSLAAAIEDKPLVCLIVRFLLLPVAGLAYLALSCPILIPLIVLLSWGIARLVLRELRRRSLRWSPRLRGQRGTMLVTLIATMVVFSTLGAVMIGMFGTSALSQASGNISMRAYYLAESGFRYAASAFVNAPGANEATRETARDNLLENNLHGKTFSLGSGDGAFRLDVYPYYYKVIEAPTTNMLKTRVTGGLPLQDLALYNNAWVTVTTSTGIVVAQVSNVSSPTGSNEVWFYKSGIIWDAGIVENSIVTPICKANATTVTQTRTEDGKTKYDLAFQYQTGAGIFPEKNGIVTVTEQGSLAKKTLGYKKLDLVANKLVDVYDPDGLSVPPTVVPGSNIALSKFIRVESTGTFGTGSSAVSRKVTFYAPVGSARATPIAKKEFKEAFDSLSSWFTGYNTSHAGTQALSSTYGGSALSVTSLAATGPSYCLNTREFQIGLNLPAAYLANGENLYLAVQQEWLRASRYLSYDVQVKLGQFSTFAFSQAFGLDFRLDEAGNTLGLSVGSFQPGLDSTNNCEKDQIPEGIIAPGSGYADYTPVITLWTKQYDKKDSAFTVVPNLGPQGCLEHPPATTGHFTIVPANLAAWETGNRVRMAPVSGSTLPEGIQENRDYFTRKVTAGSTDYIYLFDSRSDALAKENGCWIWSGLRDMTNAGSGAITATNQNAAWSNLAYQTLTTGNGFLGLSSSMTSMQFVKNWSTLLARIIEAPSVSVVNGGGTTGSEIRSGDMVYTTSDNSQAGSLAASARVRRNPVYRSTNSSDRDWAGGNAQAVLILEVLKDSGGNSLPHLFGQGKTLFVGDHPGGRNAGIVNIPAGSTDIVYRSRDNWIAVYVGDPSLVTRAPDADPYDVHSADTLLRGPIFRTSTRWPVDDVENTYAGNDYFTIVRFGSFVNSTLLCRVDGLDMSGANCLAGFYSGSNNLTGSSPDILRFSSPDGVVFNSPSSGASLPASRAEVGLHAYASSIYYDDFSLEFGPGYGITRQGFHLPIQQ
jgi:prepilin-type N-terminal cleavage/methylation domain-containing protein